MKILNDQKLQKHYRLLLGLKEPWIIDEIELNVIENYIKIFISYPNGTKVSCPICNKKCTIKDRRKERQWRHLDTMQFATYIICSVPRSNCKIHGSKTIKIPWSEPNSQFTLLFEIFAISVLKETKTIQSAKKILRVSWDECQFIRKQAVQRGLKSRKQKMINNIGIDEKSFLKKHKYATILTDIDNARVLDVVRGRDRLSTEKIFNTLSTRQKNKVQAIAMDMWESYIIKAGELLPNADIVHDKFHISKYLNKAVDKTRKKENRNFINEGIDNLKGTKYLWLKNSNNWSIEQKQQYQTIKNICIKTSRAWAIKETFSDIWTYKYKGSANSYFNKWYFWATHSRIKPIIDVAKMLKRHIDHILTYCKHRITNAVAEGLNSKIQNIKSNARGFRNFDNYRVAILFHCGKLDLYPH